MVATQFFDTAATVLSNVVQASSSRMLTIVPNPARSRSGGTSRSSTDALSSSSSSSSWIGVSLWTLAAATSSVLVMQFTTTANPVGRCYTFWKQLHHQVQFFFRNHVFSRVLDCSMVVCVCVDMLALGFSYHFNFCYLFPALCSEPHITGATFNIVGYGR
jgi:hypothetical protein